MIEYARLAWRGLSHRPLRTFLTALGIIIAVAAVFTLVASIQGLSDTVQRIMADMGTNRITIMPGTVGFLNLGGVYFTDTDVHAVSRIPGVRDVLPVALTQMRIQYDRHITGAIVEGMDPTVLSRVYKSALGAYLFDGRVLRRGDRYAALVGYKIAEDAFPRKIHVGAEIEIGGKPFKVVGVLKKTGGPLDSAIIIPLRSFEEITGIKNRYERITVVAASATETQALADRIKTVLKRVRGKEDFHVLTSERMAKTVGQILGIIGALLVSIAAIALIVGAVGIMNTMYMSVTERTREIGVMKAVGATKGQIMGIFLLEAGMLGLIGGVVGEILGVVASEGIASYVKKAVVDSFAPSYHPTMVIGLLVFAFIVGVISGYFPAKQGAELDPIEAIRQ